MNVVVLARFKRFPRYDIYRSKNFKKNISRKTTIFGKTRENTTAKNLEWPEGDEEKEEKKKKKEDKEEERRERRWKKEWLK